jgi:hypothetical protein
LKPSFGEISEKARQGETGAIDRRFADLAVESALADNELESQVGAIFGIKIPDGKEADLARLAFHASL